MATFLTTDDTKFIKENNDNRLMKEIVRISPLLKTIPIEKHPEKSGTDTYFHGRIPLAKVSGTLATSGQLTDATPVQWGSRKVKASLYTLQNAINPSWLEQKVTFDGLDRITDELRNNMSESIEAHIVTMVVPYLITFLADWDNSTPHQKHITSDGAGSTLTMTSATMSQSDDYWNASYVMPTKLTDPNYGQGRLASDFANSGDLLTVSEAWNDASGTSNNFFVADVSALTTGDAITIALIRKMMSFMGPGSLDIPFNNVFRFANPYGYGFKIFMSSLDFGDLTNDSEWKAWTQYNTQSKGYKEWSVGNILSNEIMQYGLLYRETVARAASATGAIFSTICLGPECARRLDLGKPNVQQIGGRNDADSNNIHGNKLFFSWQHNVTVGVTNGIDGCCFKTVPTALG
jgi:hypothetical protein